MKKAKIALILSAGLLVTACSGGTQSTTTAGTGATTTAGTEVTTTTADSTTASGGALYKAGTYTAQADAHNGPLGVEVVFTETKIESVKVTDHTETAGLSDAALLDIPAEMAERQTLDLDVKTGATVTSRAVKYAVADAVKQAGGEDSPLLAVDLDRPSAAELWFAEAVEKIEQPAALNGVFEVASYDELKKVLGYYDFIVNPETGEGKFMFVEGSAADGDTVKLTADLTAEGDQDNPRAADGSDKMDVVTGASLVVTRDVTIDGDGKTVRGDGYPTFMFAGREEDYGQTDGTESTLKNIIIEEGAYNAKIGGAVYVVGDATLNLENAEINNSNAGSAKLAFNGGGAIYVNSHGLTPEEGRAVLNVRDSSFSGNRTANGGGGALMALNGDINLTGVKLTGNQSLSEMGVGGAIALRGESSMTVEDTEITGNEATVAGGGIYIFDGESLFKGGDGRITSASKAVISNAMIKGNTAPHGADITYGRFYPESFAGDKTYYGLELGEGNDIGENEDLTFTTVERNEAAK